jgi:CHAT domain-containing protein
LDLADRLSWGNRWADAVPHYIKAEQLFTYAHNNAKALYSQVSQIPANESRDIPATILALTEDLSKPGADVPETRLRILTIRGMLETNYDAASARSTWQQVSELALKLGHLQLVTRAGGEEGIAAYFLGDTKTAQKAVIRAWTLSKAENDPAATVRYASVFGAGLVNGGRYKEALTPLNEAIRIATSRPDLAYPSIAVYAKIDALNGLHQYPDALALANLSMSKLQGTLYENHKAQVYISRASVYRESGDLQRAIEDYGSSLDISTRTKNYRGMTDAGGLLSQAFETAGQLRPALETINAAIAANQMIPDELYLVPRNLAIKADILSKMGRNEESDTLYKKSVSLVNVMIQHASTTNIQRQLLTTMSDVYSGYFASLSRRKLYDESLSVLEQVRGRLETEALLHHGNTEIHAPTEEEKRLTQLNISLINADDPAARARITSAIYNSELAASPSSLAQETITHPVRLAVLQRTLSRNALLLEYVLAVPDSYVLAVTREGVSVYRLPSKPTIEADANAYRKAMGGQKVDVALAQRLFAELLAPVKEYGQKSDLIVVPDGGLHLLPFSGLRDSVGYVLENHTVAVSPSATVFDLLRNRIATKDAPTMPYIGVAAWTQATDTRNPIVRAVTGPQKSQLTPLPDSKLEVEAIAEDLPRPSTILLGSEATKSRFDSLALDSTEVVHLALHGYADLDYPDRSALIFAPDASGKDDGLLKVRDIRTLHLTAKLVTLSACNTGVGPVGVAGVANLANAFIEAGADTVVSTLWELEDHSTQHLMTTFYGQLAMHERKVDALRAAQLELLKQGLPPYYWAGVQIVGDPDGAI